MSKVWRDMTGRPLRAGQAIAYGNHGRGEGISLYQIAAFEGSNMHACVITAGGVARKVSRLRFGDRALILNTSAEQLAATMIPSLMQWMLNKGKCAECESDELDIVRGDLDCFIAVGCNGCGSMFDGKVRH